MWIVRLALSRPYTFVVMSLLSKSRRRRGCGGCIPIFIPTPGWGGGGMPSFWARAMRNRSSNDVLSGATVGPPRLKSDAALVRRAPPTGGWNPFGSPGNPPGPVG